MVAFGAHWFREIGRTQLASAVKFFRLPKSLAKAEKLQLAIPLAAAFLQKNIVSIEEGADMGNLCRQDVMKCDPVKQHLMRTYYSPISIRQFTQVSDGTRIRPQK